MKLSVIICLFAAIAIAPWLRGAVRPAIEQWLAILFAVAYVARLLDDSSDGVYRRRIPLTWWAAAAGVLLGLVQLLPLPQVWLELFSPQVVEWVAPTGDDAVSADAAPDLIPPDGVERSGSLRPISLAPALTRNSLAQLICACAAMLLAVDYCREGPPLRWLLTLVTFNGGALAFVALAEKLLRRGILFWEPHKNWLGPFVNRNNGAGFLVMSLGAALALLLIDLHDRERAERRAGRSGPSLFALLRRLDAPMLAYLAAVCLMLGAVAASLSRGAVISLVVGAATAGMAMATAGRWKSIVIGLVLLGAGAIGIPASLGQLDAIQARLDTLSETDTFTRDDRTINWKAGADAAAKFLPAGSGLGSYRYAYRPFETLAANGRFHWPENAFVQTIVEAGVPGLLLFLVGLGAAVVAAVRLVRSGDGRQRALGIGGLFILSAQTVHSCLDNGFYLPANELLLATLCGLVCGAAANRKLSTSASLPMTAQAIPTFPARLMIPLLLVGLVWAHAEFHAAAPGTDIFVELYNFRDEPTTTLEFVDRALVRLEQAVRARPDDAELRRRTAEFYFVRYRRHALDELRKSYPTASSETLWNLATPSTIFAAACRAERQGDEAALLALRSQPIVTSDLIPAWRHLRLAAEATPLEAETQLYLGELQFLVGKTERSARRFELAGRLAAGRPALLLRLGIDEIDAGLQSAGFAHLQRAWLLQPALGEGLITALSPRIPWADFVRQVVPDSPTIVDDLLRTMRRRQTPPADLELLERRLSELRDR